MKQKFLLGIVLVCLLAAVSFADVNRKAYAETSGDLQSFESVQVPANWLSKSGNLNIAANRYKLGQKSLKWTIIGQEDSLTVKGEKFMKEAGSGRNIKSSGFILWVYS